MASSDQKFTTISGFDAVTGKYTDLDIDQWIKVNKIAEQGREDGENEFPLSDAKQLPDVMEKIVDWVSDRATGCFEEVNNYLILKNDALAQLNPQDATIRNKIETFCEDGKLAIKNRADDDQNALTAYANETRAAKQAYEDLRAEANLTDVPHYEARGTWFIWLFSVVIIESLANALMLADVMESGFLGGAGIMFFISIVNAGLLGWVVGEGCRIKNTVKKSTATCGYLMVGVGILLMVIGNLVVGHFRDSTRAVIYRATEQAQANLNTILADDTIPRFLSSPFGLNDMFSWVLAIVGGCCCFFAASKWYSRDDPYPKHGHAHRVYERHLDSYDAQILNHRNELEQIFNEVEAKIQDEALKIQNQKGAPQTIQNQINAVLDQWEMQLSKYQQHQNRMLAAYRSANERARRTTAPPRFFEHEIKINPQLLVAPKFEPVSINEYGDDLEDFFQAALNDIRETYKSVLNHYPTIEEFA